MTETISVTYELRLVRNGVHNLRATYQRERDALDYVARYPAPPSARWLLVERSITTVIETKETFLDGSRDVLMQSRDVLMQGVGDLPARSAR